MNNDEIAELLEQLEERILDSSRRVDGVEGVKKYQLLHAVALLQEWLRGEDE